MLLEKLIAKQKELAPPKQKRLSDQEFATMLGVSRQLWNFSRRNGRLYPAVLIGVLGAFPEFTSDALIEMAQPGMSPSEFSEFKERLLERLKDEIKASTTG